MNNPSSGEGMKHLLHIIILFEFVDEPEDLRRLSLGKLDRHRANVLMLG